MRFKGYDLNLLAAAEILLTERNVSRAADRLNLSQSAMSSALARLREQFDDDMLVPVGRGFRLSPRAEVLLPRIRAILDRIEYGVINQEIRDPSRATRHVRIMASDYVALTVLAPGMLKLSLDAPGLTFEIVRMVDRPKLSIEQYEVDLLIAPDIFVSPDHPTCPYFEDDYVALACTDSSYAKTQLTNASYLSAPQVSVSFRLNGDKLHDDRYLEQSGQRKQTEVTVPSHAILPYFLMRSSRIATLQRRQAEIFSKTFPLKILELPVNIPTLKEVFQWHRSNEEDPVLQYIRDSLISNL